MKTEFSVLLSIYHRESPEYFDRCMCSVWDEQILKPDEIILVQDGKLTDDLYAVIEKWEKKLGDIFKVVQLEKNVGLGDALNEGLKHCSNELVARMDTDDISLPHRFEEQVKVFESKNIDVCSAWISEFDGEEDNIVSYRKLPENHDEIFQFGKRRSPVNHIPVMFKKGSVEKAGGYQKMMWLEDYYLWGRMLMSGSKFYNIQKPLANIRAGYDQLQRRSGLAYAKSELRLQQEFLRIGFISPLEFTRNSTIRFIARIMPKNIIKAIYKLLRK
jgi:glycosyltransferase involved in cell wall biosynthesis